jgi:aspartate dehydrogenase
VNLSDDIRRSRLRGRFSMTSMIVDNSLLDATEPPRTSTNIKVGIAGMGAIGSAIVKHISQGNIPGFTLSAVAVRDRGKAEAALGAMTSRVQICELSELAENADVVIECLPAALFDQAVRPSLMAGKKVVVLSAGALLNHYDLVELARSRGGQIIVPTGALLGLDAVCAAAEGKIFSVNMVTRKPVAGLLGAPYLIKNKIDISNIKEPLRVFAGTARDAAVGFPANLNVAVALSLAGIGPDKTTLEIWADPTVVRNTHRIFVNSDSALLDMTVENIPSENPKTGRITALSVVSLLRKTTAALRVGS